MQGRVLAAQDAVRRPDPGVPISLCTHDMDHNRYIKQAAQKLHDEFEDDVPKTADELCSLPGVGPKMAFLALQVAWKLYVSTRLPGPARHRSRRSSRLIATLRFHRNAGIGVDVHVHLLLLPRGRGPREARGRLGRHSREAHVDDLELAAARLDPERADDDACDEARRAEALADEHDAPGLVLEHDLVVGAAVFFAGRWRGEGVLFPRRVSGGREGERGEERGRTSRAISSRTLGLSGMSM